MRDEIKEMTADTNLNIITNNNTSDENGSHWSAFHINNKGEKFWFDSYGSPVLEEIVQIFKSPILGNTIHLNFKNLTLLIVVNYLYIFYTKLNNGKSMGEICLELFSFRKV